jgi:hypothetical protein
MGVDYLGPSSDDVAFFRPLDELAKCIPAMEHALYERGSDARSHPLPAPSAVADRIGERGQNRRERLLIFWTYRYARLHQLRASAVAKS